MAKSNGLKIGHRRGSGSRPLQMRQADINELCLERLGIATGADLREQSSDFLPQPFGKSGLRCYRIARGIDEWPVEPNRPRKSIGAEDTLSADIFEFEAARREITPLAAKVWHHCETRGRHGEP